MLENFPSQLGHSSAVVEAAVARYGWRSVLMQMEQFFGVNHGERVHQHSHFVIHSDTEW
jgi:hypothetical protein